MYMFRHWANGENHLNTITVQACKPYTERDLPELPPPPPPSHANATRELALKREPATLTLR